MSAKRRPKKYASKPPEMRGLRQVNGVWYLELKRKDVTFGGSLHTTSLDEAIATRARIINQGRLESNHEGFKANYRRFLADKQKRGEYTASSLTGKPYAILKFGERIHDAAPGTIRPNQVQSWYDHLRYDRGLSAETCHGYVKALRAFAKWCVGRKPALAQLDFTEGVRMEKFVPGVRDKWCDAKLRDKLCEEAGTPFKRQDGETESEWEGREDVQFVCYAGFHAGLRMSEVVALRPEWFDLERRILVIPNLPGVFVPKGKRRRSIPLSKPFTAFLKKYGLRSPFMLRPDVAEDRPRKGETTTLRYDYRRPLAKYMEAQGVPWVTSHVMRHTFATLALHAGVTPYEVCGWHGARWPTFEKNYSHHFPNTDSIDKAF